jgi:hypothetical protein
VYQYLILSMDDPTRFRAAEVDVLDRMPFSSVVTNVPGKGLILLVDFIKPVISGPEYCCDPLLALDLTTGKGIPSSPDMYRYLHLSGGTWGYGNQGSGIGLRQFENGRLMLSIGQRVYDIGTPLPPPMRLPQGGKLGLALDTTKMIVASDGERSTHQLTIYVTEDKRTGQWSRLPVRGFDGNLRAFGHWIAGMINEPMEPGHERLSPGRREDGFRPRVPLPEITINEYLQRQETYRPGVLFLYNVETHIYYEWNTHDGDSEVIFMDGDVVYYRVDRVLYRATMGAKELGKSEVVAEDDLMPGIHWAFFGPPTAKR